MSSSKDKKMSESKCSNSLELSKFTETSILPDFTFIVDGIKYKCKTIQICSISQVIYKQIPNFNLSEESYKNYDKNFIYNFDDITSENSTVTCHKLKDPHHYFQLFLDAVEGKNITITKFNAFFFNYIAILLQINELKKATDPFMNFRLNVNNAIQILFYFSESNIRNNEVINYVASNWSQFDFPIEAIMNYKSNNNANKSDLLKLDKMLHLTYEFFDFVFSNKNFKPRSDKWLFHFIYLLVKFNKNSKDYCLLFKYVKFEKLTNTNLNKIIKLIAIDAIPSDLFYSFERRFTSEIDGKSLLADEELDSDDFDYDSFEEDDDETNENEIEFAEKTIEFPFKYEFNDCFKGVFSFLSQNKNAFKQNVKSFCGGTKQQLLFHVFEYQKSILFEYYWDSFNKAGGCNINNAWIVVSFPNHKFKLKNYTIATSPISREFIQHGIQPKSWIVEGSNSVIEARSSLIDSGDVEKAASEIKDANWELIAKEKENKSLFSKNEVIKTFGVEARYQNFYRSFRFKMLENNAAQDDNWYGLLKLNALEFYGTLVELVKKKKV